MKKQLIITVHGRGCRWSFPTYGDTKYLEEWRADGLEIYVIENTVPMWVARLRLVRLWCFVQDVFNFKNPL